MRTALLALLLAGCAHVRMRSTEWVVYGNGPADQALAIVDAAHRVYPGKLPQGGMVKLIPGDAYVACYGPKPPAEYRVVTGCVIWDGVAIMWPTPFDCADLTCSALPHELAHVAGAATEDQANAGALLVVQEYRRR